MNHFISSSSFWSIEHPSYLYFLSTSTALSHFVDPPFDFLRGLQRGSRGGILLAIIVFFLPHSQRPPFPVFSWSCSALLSVLVLPFGVPYDTENPPGKGQITSVLFFWFTLRLALRYHFLPTSCQDKTTNAQNLTDRGERDDNQKCQSHKAIWKAPFIPAISALRMSYSQSRVLPTGMAPMVPMFPCALTLCGIPNITVAIHMSYRCFLSTVGQATVLAFCAWDHRITGANMDGIFPARSKRS